MNTPSRRTDRRRGPLLAFLSALVLLMAAPAAATAQESRSIPPALRPWESWATWNDTHRFCPTPYSDPKIHRCHWPSRLELQVTNSGGRFTLFLTAFHETWVPLPGGADAWPQDVRVAGRPVVVVERDGAPAVRVGPGDARLEGVYRWNELPQGLKIPGSLGILSLVRDNRAVDNPVWDAQGQLWLRRDASAETTERNFLEVRVSSLLEDGIPMWWRQEVELTIAGRSREEDLGHLLPEGWRLASVKSPIPVSVDAEGRAKAQVRAGTWTVRLESFRHDNPTEVRFAPGTRPAVPEQLVAFRAKPEFRVLEFTGPPSIDPSQNRFPADWKNLPVHRWDPKAPVRLVERLRGMGAQKPAGLAIERTLWLDEDGRGLTFQDRLEGQMQQVWRLDAAEGQELGSVSSQGEGQLITINPVTRAAGVELRSRSVEVEATGRLGNPASLPATGWRSDAESVRVTLHLPPGWRLLALFGADWVQGDWLTAWTLLDLFLLLVFSLAVFRLRGWATAILAFAAFGLAYHEPGAPRYPWLALLVPLALAPRLPQGTGRRLVSVGQALAVGLLLLGLVPFVTRQVQQALYPQLEPSGDHGFAPPEARQKARMEQVPKQVPTDTVPTPGKPGMSPEMLRRYGLVAAARATGDASAAGPTALAASGFMNNLGQDDKARIQTGPGIPEWTWRSVSFGWNGPVGASQRLRPVLVPLGLERALTVLRTGLLIALAALLLRGVRPGGGSRTTPEDDAPPIPPIPQNPQIPQIPQATPPPPPVGPSATASLAVALLVLGGMVTILPAARADDAIPRAAEAVASPADGATIPDAATLETLRRRLLETSDAFPNAASIARVNLGIRGQRLRMEMEIHCATQTAVPLPGRLPSLSPLTVGMDGQWSAAVRRDDGYLWAVVPAGVHTLRLEAQLAGAGDWEWTYLLKPRQVNIDAPDWTVVGVRPDGVPEAQVFFSPKQKATAEAASYDRQDLQPIVAIERRIELGLQWRVRTVVRRLSPAGRAVSLRIPLLPGENVLTTGRSVQDGGLEVRLGAQEETFEWEGGLAPVETLALASRASDTWVERWHLATSPVWHVELSGLAPVFESGNTMLEPVWRPWPGESVSLAVRRPEAVAGSTMTVNRVEHGVTLGQRQRLSTLDLTIRCSLGEDFRLELPADAEITTLTHLRQEIPVRREGTRLIVPLRPGEQTLTVGWKENLPQGLRADNGRVRLPVEGANVHSSIGVGQDRWVLWASGPRRGPAVRFWGILAVSLLAGLALGRLPGSPLGVAPWMLLLVGLTQVPLPAAAVVIGWFFVVRWRGQPAFQGLPWLAYDAAQVLLAALTLAALGILVYAVSAGLLGNPRMFIIGNESTSTLLRWFQARTAGEALPVCECVSVSIWWYRFAMLLWALWLAVSVLGWLGLAWRNFASGGFLRRHPGKQAEAATPPAPPTLGAVASGSAPGSDH